MDLRHLFLTFLILNVKGLLSDEKYATRRKKFISWYIYSDSYTLFATRFWRVAVKHLPKEENLIFYPISLLRVLTWLQLGTNKNSEAQIRTATSLKYDQWRTHLHSYQDSVKDAEQMQTFSVGDGGYYDNGLRKYVKMGYKNELLQNFKLDVTKLPPYENPTLTSFYLNKDLEKITHKKIKRFFNSSMFGKNGNGMLFSGLHFKASWQTVFNKQNTKENDFQVNSKKKVKVPMMNLKLELLIARDYKQMGFNLIEVPLENSRYKVLIIEPTGFSLEKIIEKLPGLEMIGLLHNLGNKFYNVDLTLPKFKFDEKKHDFTHYLIDNEVGIRDIFNEIKADFSNMTFKKDVLAQEISEASYFEITETAVEIAGVVNGHLVGNENRKSLAEETDYESDETEEGYKMEIQKLTVNINQPFMFILMDTKFQIPLVMGKISNPKQG